MTEQGILLVLLSACLHASWNIISKTGGDPVSFLLRALGFSAILYAPLGIWMQMRVHYTPTIVFCILASGAACGVYFVALGKAYQHGKVSVAYPVASAFPILFITVGGLLLGEVPSLTGFGGILLIIAGSLVLPLQRFVWGSEGFALSNYYNRSVLWALGSAVGTAAFSIVDKIAATAMSSGTAVSAFDKINYVYLQNFIAWLIFLVAVRIMRFPVHKAALKRTAVSGLILLVSYSLIIFAMVTDPVVYVVSFRKLSLVIGALISMFWVERDFSWPRLVGAVMVFIGVVLVGIA